VPATRSTKVTQPNARWDVDGLTPSQREQYHAFANDWLSFVEASYSIEDRDRAGYVHLLKFRDTQRELWDEIQRIRSINLYRDAKRKRKLDLLAGIIKREDWPKRVDIKPSDWIARIFELHPEYVYNRALELSDDGSFLSDGPVMLVIGKGRRAGFSTVIQTMAWAYHTFRYPTRSLLLSLDDNSAKNVFGLNDTAFRNTPHALHWIVPALEASSTNERRMLNGSEAFAVTSQGAQVRSFQFNFVHATEVAFYERQAAYGAAQIGLPPDVFFFEESTGNGPTGVFFNNFQAASSTAAVIARLDQGESVPNALWFRLFVPWYKDKQYVSSFDTEQERYAFEVSLTELEQSYLERAAGECTLEHLKWRRETIETRCKDEILTPEQVFKREFPFDVNEMFLAAGSEIFDLSSIERREIEIRKLNPIKARFVTHKQAIVSNVSEDMANLWLLEPPTPDDDYLVTADSSKGVGKDAFVVDVWKRRPIGGLQCVAHFRDKRGVDIHIGFLAVALATYYNNAWIAPEMNESAAGAMVTAIVHMCRYKRVVQREQNATIKTTSGASFNYGVYVTSGLKETMIGELVAALIGDEIKLLHLEQANQLRTYKRNTKTGKLGGDVGTHDDTVMSAAIAVWKNKPLRGLPVVRKLREDYKPKSDDEDKAKANAAATAQSLQDIEDRRVIEAIDAMERRLRAQQAPPKRLAWGQRSMVRRWNE
jgi:hypothetical protein